MASASGLILCLSKVSVWKAGSVLCSLNVGLGAVAAPFNWFRHDDALQGVLWLFDSTHTHTHTHRHTMTVFPFYPAKHGQIYMRDHTATGGRALGCVVRTADEWKGQMVAGSSQPSSGGSLRCMTPSERPRFNLSFTAPSPLSDWLPRQVGPNFKHHITPRMLSPSAMCNDFQAVTVCLGTHPSLSLLPSRLASYFSLSLFFAFLSLIPNPLCG